MKLAQATVSALRHRADVATDNGQGRKARAYTLTATMGTRAALARSPSARRALAALTAREDVTFDDWRYIQRDLRCTQ